MSSRLARVENWAEHAKAANFRAGDLARLCGISPRQLERFFLLKHGKSPQQWLDELRQSEAVSLLAEGYSIKEIADALGYLQAANFCRAFKRFHGFPAESRAKLRHQSRRDVAG